MIYGLYLSATGVLTNSYRQDVIANNLANSETVGFKKDLALFQQRRTEAQERGFGAGSNALLEGLGGGGYASPTRVDTSQGDLGPAGSNLDVGGEGTGNFNVNDNGQAPLSADGRFSLDRTGPRILAKRRRQAVP